MGKQIILIRVIFPSRGIQMHLIEVFRQWQRKIRNVIIQWLENETMPVLKTAVFSTRTASCRSYMLGFIFFFSLFFKKKISFLLYKLLRIKEGTSFLARDNEKERKRETERKNIRWGLNFFLRFTLWKLPVGFGEHKYISGARAHGDLFNMAATASGCTACEGCFHCTATTPFLAGSLFLTAAQAGLHKKKLFSSLRALLFARRVFSRNTYGQRQLEREEKNANII